MAVVDDLKTAFSGQRGKILAVGGGVVVVYLWWTRGRTNKTPQGIPGVDPPDGLHRTASAPSGETTSGPGPSSRPANNADWQDQAVNILSAPPYNYSATAVYNAIAKAYLGQPLTAQEEDYVRLAIRVNGGSPPEGMPPLNSSAPSGGQTGTPLEKPALRVASIDRNGVTVDWPAVEGADWYDTFARTKFGSTGGADNQGTSVHFSVSDLGALVPGDYIDVLVIAHASDGTRAPDASIRVNIP